MASYLHKKCNPTMKRFYEDFDKLPVELRRMLNEGSHSPTFDDLKAAWQLAHEMGLITDKVAASTHSLHAQFKSQRYKDKLAARKAKKEIAWAKKWKYASRGGVRTVYQRVVKLPKRTDKHKRLILLLTDEEAMRMLSERKEVKDVGAPFSSYWKKVGTTRVKPDTKAIEYFGDNKTPIQNLSKMMHNAGGKTESNVEKLAKINTRKN